MASRLLPDAAGDSSSKHSRQEGRLYPAGVPSAAGAGRCQRCTPRRPGLCLLPVPQPVQCCCSPGGRARSRARTPGRLVGSGGYGETLGYAPWQLRLSARSPPGQSPSEGASSGWLPLPLQPVRLLRPSAGACSARALPTSMAMASNRPAIACGAHAHFASNPSPTCWQNSPERSRRQPANAAGLATSASRSSSAASSSSSSQHSARVRKLSLRSVVVMGSSGEDARGFQGCQPPSGSGLIRHRKTSHQQLGAETRGPLAVAVGLHLLAQSVFSRANYCA